MRSRLAPRLPRRKTNSASSAFTVCPTYRRSAAGARGSGATDKPVCCNALLGSGTRCPDDSHHRGRHPTAYLGLAIRFGFRVGATVGVGAEGFRTADFFDDVAGFRCAGSSTVVVSITSIVIVSPTFRAVRTQLTCS